MKRTLWAVFCAALLLAASLLAGCGGKEGALDGFVWAIEPRYEFERVEPVLDADPMKEGTACTAPGEAGYYLAKTESGWAVLDTADGRLALEGAFPHQPYRCGMGHLYGPDAQYSGEQAGEYDAQLAALGSTFRMEVGHGGRARRYLWDQEAGQVLRIQVNEGSFWELPLAELEDPFAALLPVRRGVRYEPAETGFGAEHDPIEPEENGLYAVASPAGGLLTDFVYENAGMAGPELIAVQKGGKWGYVNGEGREVIPCEYEGFWGPRWQWSEAAGGPVCEEANYPAPCTGGCVVVKKNGETGVLRADGSVLLAFGQVEDAAPAQGGLLWVKTEGRWGALRLPEK